MFGKFRFRGRESGKNNHEFRFLDNFEFYEWPLRKSFFKYCFRWGTLRVEDTLAKKMSKNETILGLW